MAKYKNRVKKLIYIKASELVPNPWNFRRHDDKQKMVLQEVFDSIGVAGAVIVREVSEGKYCLIDGHLRREELGDDKVPAIVVDLDEDEAKMLLAVYDPLSGMAETDKNAHAILTKELVVHGPGICSLFNEMAEGNTVLDEDNLDLDIESDDEESLKSEGGDIPNKELSESQVRMVQLYCSASNEKEFESMAAELSIKFDTTNLTDTVFSCFRYLLGKIDLPEKKDKKLENKKEVKKSKKKVEEEE